MRTLQNLRHNDGCDLLRFAASQATCRKRQLPTTCPLDCLLSCQMRWLEQLHHSTLGQNEFFKNENRWRSVGCLGESTWSQCRIFQTGELWWCAELVFLCAMSPDHVLYPPDLLCSLVLLDSLLFLQVLPLLPKARILSQIVRQIVSGNTQEVVTGFLHGGREIFPS